MSAVLAVDGGNSRPTSRSCATTARCSRSRAGRTARRTRSAWTVPRAARAALLGEALERRAGARRPPAADVGSVLMAGVDFPREEETLQAARRRARVGDARDGRQRHVRGAARRHRPRLGRGARVRRRDQLRRRRPRRTHVRFPALGAITGDWGGGYDVGLAAASAQPRAARTAAGRRPRSSRSCRATSGSAPRWRSPRRSSWTASTAQRIGELAPLVLRAAARTTWRPGSPSGS